VSGQHRRPGRRVAVLAWLTATALAVAGCGVPTSSGVELVGPGPQGGSTLRSGGSPPPLADAAATPREQVDNFLQAAAGTPDTAADRVREYIRSTEQDTWNPDEGIRVIRLRQDPFVNDDVDNGGWLVQIDNAQLVGELHPNGYLDAPTSNEPVDFEFRVVTEGGPDGEVGDQPLRLRIADPPPYLLLQDTALANDDYYYPNPIYFWDSDFEVLVPDLRWLPLAGESVEQRPWTVVRWLLAGPAPSLPRMEGLPAGTQHNGLPVWDENRLVVNFNAIAVEGGRQSIDDFATQLAWSLLQLREGAELELRIDDRPQQVRPRPQPESADPVRFVVLDGVIHQYRSGADPPAQPPALSEQINSGVHAAALTSRGEVAALVRQRPDGQQELSVTRSLAGAEPAEEPAGLVAEELGQPVWLSGGAAAVGLVVADGELHRFHATGGAAAVPLAGLAGPITAVAVAPERRRLAMIAGGRLYLAQLRNDGESVTVQAPRALPTTVQELAGVAFSHESQLVIAGVKDFRVGLYQLTADGAVEEPLHDLGNAAVTALVAHPIRDPADLPALMYEANGQAYAFGGVPTLIRPQDLADPPEAAESLPRAPSFLG
jgi:hypothetical protein